MSITVSHSFLLHKKLTLHGAGPGELETHLKDESSVIVVSASPTRHTSRLSPPLMGVRYKRDRLAFFRRFLYRRRLAGSMDSGVWAPGLPIDLA